MIQPPKRFTAMLLLSLFGAGCAGQIRHSGLAAPELLGSFTDDYGSRYLITDSIWIQLPATRYHIVHWDPVGQYLVAWNDSTNHSDPGKWTRIDWLPLTGMLPYRWGFCYSAWNAPTQAAAESVTVAKRDTPRSGCNGYPFSRMASSTGSDR